MFEDNSDIRPWVRIGEVLDGALDKLLPPEASPEREDEKPQRGAGEAPYVGEPA